MKPGDLVRFFSYMYPKSEIIGVILDKFPMKHHGGTTYRTLCISGPELGSSKLNGKVTEIHSTVWPGSEVISEAG